MKEFLTTLIRSRLSQEGLLWLDQAVFTLEHSSQGEEVLHFYSAAGRKTGKRALLLSPSEKQQLQVLRADLPLDHWGADEAARAILLLSLAHLPAAPYRELALRCYQLGDSREQQSWLRALILLPGCERFQSAATDACRANIIPLFESIACENPYPSAYFPELNFNQMVLKALFNGIAVARIIGLESRFNPELSRMADDYASEREAAGREVPADIWLVLAPRIGTERRARVYHYLQHANARHRYWAAIGLGFLADGESEGRLQKRKAVETEPEVMQALESSLAKIAARRHAGEKP